MIIFYVFMFVMTLLIPATMLVFGYLWKKKPPEKINYGYGYRTKRSMASKEAWNYAHKHCGATWVKLGWFTGVISVLLMIVLPFITLETVVVSIVSLVIVFLQMIPLIAPLITTERALKREFKI